jgi:hypothetical protein
VGVDHVAHHCRRNVKEASRDLKVVRDSKVRKDHRGRKALRVLRVMMVCKALRVHAVELRVNLEFKERTETTVLKERPVKVKPVFKDHVVKTESKARMAHKETMESKARLAFKDLEAMMVSKVRMVLKVSLVGVRLAFKAPVVKMDSRVKLAKMDLRVNVDHKLPMVCKDLVVHAVELKASVDLKAIRVFKGELGKMLPSHLYSFGVCVVNPRPPTPQ